MAGEEMELRFPSALLVSIEKQHGSIRSYVFQPYQMVKDLRTGVESGNIQDVMDGNLDPFIEAMLRGHKRER